MQSALVPDETLHSYADVTGEWESRKISIFGVARSFIGQLTYGQDLTRVSMPSVFLLPLSVLELCSSRYNKYLHVLFELNHTKDPLQRMAIVLKWFCGFLSEVEMQKKPYNSVVGETHKSFTESEKYGPTVTVAEQVTHHPPVTAMFLRNDKQNLEVHSNSNFSVKFHGNSVTVTGKGFIIIDVVNVEGKRERYHIDKPLPDLLIKNVILGTRVHSWTGDLEIWCEQTQYRAYIEFGKGEKKSIVSGVMSHDTDGEFPFKGDYESVIFYTNAKNQKFTLYDSQGLSKAKLLYPEQDELSSLKLWAQVSKHIIANDMFEADAAKHTIEADQRKRVAAGEDEKTDRKYFHRDEEHRWHYKRGSCPLIQEATAPPSPNGVHATSATASDGTVGEDGPDPDSKAFAEKLSIHDCSTPNGTAH